MFAKLKLSSKTASFKKKLASLFFAYHSNGDIDEPAVFDLWNASSEIITNPECFDINDPVGGGSESTGDTLLHIAVMARKVALVQLLLKSGADPNRPNMEGETAVHAGCRNSGRFFGMEIIMELVDAGGDVHLRSVVDDESPLELAGRDTRAAILEMVERYEAKDRRESGSPSAASPGAVKFSSYSTSSTTPPGHLDTEEEKWKGERVTPRRIPLPPATAFVPGTVVGNEEIPGAAAASVDLRSLFSKLDVDRNGFISPVDLHRVLQLEGIPVTEAEVDVMIEMMDPEGDGQIDFHKFVSHASTI